MGIHSKDKVFNKYLDTKRREMVNLHRVNMLEMLTRAFWSFQFFVCGKLTFWEVDSLYSQT